MEGRRIAISDIHGCNQTFQALLDKISLNKADQLFLLGDFIDRGPDSKGVIDKIFELEGAGYQVKTLMGNHEDMLFEALKSTDALEHWVGFNGGYDTLMSFEVEHPSSIPDKYLNFFNKLEWYLSLEEYILVHAGLNFQAPDPFKDYDSMVWIRNYETDLNQTNNKLLIHGHTPIPFERIKENANSPCSRLNIDNGCAYDKPGLNGLVALNLDDFSLTRIQNVD
ncbi:MAG: serine/threonine protein phosphatase [Bacteroidetes bacterium SW_10_40_5]|nr:MAG: serine/threonine protein phosphatase [Bacteroidetes bacterium SW_10_40_5]